MHSFDVISIGNVVVDIFLNLSDSQKHIKLNSEGEIQIKLGDKVHLEKYTFSLGGDASNVAIGSSRLGLTSCLIAETGYDEFLIKIQKTLEKEGVDRSRLIRGQVSESAFSIILNFKGDRIIFAEDRVREHKFDFQNLSARLVYLTSLGRNWEDAYAQALKFADEQRSVLVLNPGMYQIENVKLLENTLKRCDLIFLNKEEAETVLGTNQSDIKSLIQEIRDLGPKEVVITDGKKGSYLLDKDSVFYKSPMIEGELLERTGAGDAFASGYISALLKGLSATDRLLWGSLNAASVVSRLGAIEGLLTKEQMEQRQKEAGGFKVDTT